MKKEIFHNVASCALQRWATFAGIDSSDAKRRAADEKTTLFAALSLANFSLTKDGKTGC